MHMQADVWLRHTAERCLLNAVAQTKMARLKEMLKRNAKDKVLAPQIQLQLQQATQQLQAAQAQHAHATKSQSDRDAQKKWLKF